MPDFPAFALQPVSHCRPCPSGLPPKENRTSLLSADHDLTPLCFPSAAFPQAASDCALCVRYQWNKACVHDLPFRHLASGPSTPPLHCRTKNRADPLCYPTHATREVSTTIIFDLHTSNSHDTCLPWLLFRKNRVMNIWFKPFFDILSISQFQQSPGSVQT